MTMQYACGTVCWMGWLIHRKFNSSTWEWFNSFRKEKHSNLNKYTFDRIILEQMWHISLFINTLFNSFCFWINYNARIHFHTMYRANIAMPCILSFTLKFSLWMLLCCASHLFRMIYIIIKKHNGISPFEHCTRLDPMSVCHIAAAFSDTIVEHFPCNFAPSFSKHYSSVRIFRTFCHTHARSQRKSS